MRRLYLDIDGVLTARPHTVPDIELSVNEIGKVVLEWDPPTVLALMQSYGEVVWATSWIIAPGELDEVEELLGLEPRRLDRVGLTAESYLSSLHNGVSCGKLDAVKRYEETWPSGGGFMWLDDEIGSRDAEWAYSVGGRVLRPNYNAGGIYPLMNILVS